MSPEPFDNRRASVLVGANDVAQIFRVELLGENRRPDEVDEQHGELTAFGLVPGGLKRFVGTGLLAVCER